MSQGYLPELSAKAYSLPHANAVCRELVPGAALALVTNGILTVQRGRVQKSGRRGLLPGSDHFRGAGVAKPDPRFFQAARDASRSGPEELLAWATTRSPILSGALAAGIDACWYSPGGSRRRAPGTRPPGDTGPAGDPAARVVDIHMIFILV